MEQSYSQFHTRPQSQIKQMDVLPRHPKFALSFWLAMCSFAHWMATPPSIGLVPLFFFKKKTKLCLFSFLFWSLDIGWRSPRTVSVVPFQESILVILFPISLTIVRSLDHLYEIQNSHRFQTSTSKCKHSDLNPNIIVRAFSLISI